MNLYKIKKLVLCKLIPLTTRPNRNLLLIVERSLIISKSFFSLFPGASYNSLKKRDTLKTAYLPKRFRSSSRIFLSLEISLLRCFFNERLRREYEDLSWIINLKSWKASWSKSLWRKEASPLFLIGCPLCFIWLKFFISSKTNNTYLRERVKRK